MKYLILSILSVLACSVGAKELKYPVADIPADLLSNAHTVVRLYDQRVEIQSDKDVTVDVTEVKTIMNQNGLNEADLILHYNPMIKVGSIKGKVYDALGKQVKSFGYEDIKDYSAISDFSLYQDDRVKHIDPKYLQYPFTVEYSYQLNMKQSFFVPEWEHGSEYTAYQKSIYTLVRPESFEVQIKAFNLQKPAVTTTADHKITMIWALENMKARTDEPLSSIYTVDYPRVDIVVKKFSIGDTQGSMESWQSYGMWVDGLLKDRDKLPDATVAQIKKMTENCKTDFEKIKTVYEFVQKKTRYVNVSIGIGGWQPLEASVVDKFSYGDCKALTNYTRALLATIGIKSYYTVVNAGSDADAVDNSFVSNHFNHVFLSVPLAKDTVWLECTNQTLPCGFNGEFTDDRWALLVDGENSKLVRTRVYPFAENCMNRSAYVRLDNDFGGTAEVKTHYIGLKYSDILPLYYADNADKIKQATQRVDLPSFTLNTCKYFDNRSSTPSFDENLNLTVTNYVKVLQGNTAFLPLSFMCKFNDIPAKVRNRKSGMTLRRDELENDSIVFELPSSLQIGSIPPPAEIKSKFGSYKASCSVAGNKVTYIRQLKQFKGEFAPEDYSEYRDFLEQIVTADEAVAGLVKKQ